jgi:hypothetical protein
MIKRILISAVTHVASLFLIIVILMISIIIGGAFGGEGLTSFVVSLVVFVAICGGLSGLAEWSKDEDDE